MNLFSVRYNSWNEKAKDEFTTELLTHGEVLVRSSCLQSDESLPVSSKPTERRTKLFQLPNNLTQAFKK